jgi:two-component sensor histidine kinase/PAS domain-containing protein
MEERTKRRRPSPNPGNRTKTENSKSPPPAFRAPARSPLRKKVKATAEHLASFPELNPNPVMEVDLEGSVRYANPSARRLFPGLEKAGVSHPWLAGIRQGLDRIRRGKVPQASSVVAVDGRHYYQAFLFVERLRRIRIFGIDISDRVAAEEALRHKAEELETVLQSVPAVVWIAHDRECLHITGNRAADDLLRLSHGAEASLTAPEGKRPTHFRVIRDGCVMAGDELPVQRAARGEALSDFDYSIVFDDGVVRHMMGNATPLYDAQGRPRGSVSAFIDITDRKTMEDRLKTSLAEKDVLMRELAHRTKNNMQVISSLMSLQAATITDENLLNALSDTQNRIQAMALVHEKLYRTGKFSSLDIKEYAEDLLNAIIRAHPATMGHVRTETDLDNLSVSIDAALPIGLIINELVSNSLKHAFPGRESGTICMSIRRCGMRTEMRYRDDGPGLPGDFELSKSPTLGLKLVHNLAMLQLRGTMEIRHDPHTEFVFTFGDLTEMVV